MSASPIIRPLVHADRPAWEPLWKGYNAFYQRVIPAEMTELTWNRCLDPCVPMHALGAEIDGMLVGVAHVIYHLSTSCVQPIGVLQDLFTDPSHRRRGVGRALIEAVYADAARRDARRIYWHTHESNAAARRLYDAVAIHRGFIRYQHDS